MYYEKAARMQGKTGEELLVSSSAAWTTWSTAWASPLPARQARQLVSHAHFTVNGKKVNIPSYLVKPGDVIEVRDTSRSSAIFKRLTGEDAPVVLVPEWLTGRKTCSKARCPACPSARTSMICPLRSNLIVELYSK